jgi:protein-tyrosine phosphatase
MFLARSTVFFLRPKNNVEAIPVMVINHDRMRILFVCMGNICRSPTAESVMRKLVRDAGLESWIEVDSAGTHDYNVGAPPDSRAQEAARARGYDLSCLRGRQIAENDFRDFDLLLAMDFNNLSLLQSMCPFEYRSKVGLLMSYARKKKVRYVPDPYCRGSADFGKALDYIEDACAGLLDTLCLQREAMRSLS